MEDEMSRVLDQKEADKTGPGLYIQRGVSTRVDTTADDGDQRPEQEWVDRLEYINEATLRSREG
jgi:hypothetical protein